jgi:hypothetical protein
MENCVDILASRAKTWEINDITMSGLESKSLDLIEAAARPMKQSHVQALRD